MPCGIATEAKRTAALRQRVLILWVGWFTNTGSPAPRWTAASICSTRGRARIDVADSSAAVQRAVATITQRATTFGQGIAVQRIRGAAHTCGIAVLGTAASIQSPRRRTHRLGRLCAGQCQTDGQNRGEHGQEMEKWK